MTKEEVADLINERNILIVQKNRIERQLLLVEQQLMLEKDCYDCVESNEKS